LAPYRELSAHFSPTTTTWSRGRRSRGTSKCSGSHPAVRPLAGSRKSGHKLGHKFEPTQAGPGHRERDARHKSPVQGGCSRFQPRAPKPLKSLGRARSPWVQIPRRADTKTGRPSWRLFRCLRSSERPESSDGLLSNRVAAGTPAARRTTASPRWHQCGHSPSPSPFATWDKRTHIHSCSQPRQAVVT
jgi:hypothetical protein